MKVNPAKVRPAEQGRYTAEWLAFVIAIPNIEIVCWLADVQPSLFGSLGLVEAPGLRTVM